jgi:peptidyl-Lys metalloendopeptidase
MQVDKSPATRYTTWFGAYEQHRYEDVQVNLENLIDNAFPEYTSPYTFDCACTLAGSYGWVKPLDSYVSPFFLPFVEK